MAGSERRGMRRGAEEREEEGRMVTEKRSVKRCSGSYHYEMLSAREDRTKVVRSVGKGDTKGGKGDVGRGGGESGFFFLF